MMEKIPELLLIAPIASPVILLLIQTVKKVLPENVKKFIPFISIGLGIGVSIAINYGRAYGLNILQTVIVGILVGGTAVGLYESGKNIL